MRSYSVIVRLKDGSVERFVANDIGSLADIDRLIRELIPDHQTYMTRVK